MKVAEFFFLMNDTTWNLSDDELFVVNRRWFDKWKAYVQYDYIVRHVMDEKRSIKDLSMNKLINSGGSNPGDVTNKFILMESKDFYHNRLDRCDYCNHPIKEDCIWTWDFITTSKALWKLFKKNYDGLELLRYSIVKDKLGKLFRDAFLPKVKVAIMRR